MNGAKGKGKSLGGPLVQLCPDDYFVHDFKLPECC